MPQNDDKLIKTSSTLNKLSPLNVGFGAKVRTAQAAGELASSLLDYSRYPNRIILCIDDSGSMSSQMTDSIKDELGHLEETPKKQTRIEMCQKACEEFTNVCDPRDTILGLYTISTGKSISLSTNFVHLTFEIRSLEASGGTPTIQTLSKIQEKENVTRVIIISDGESGAIHSLSNELSLAAKEVLDKYKEKKCLIDTVFIGVLGSQGEAEMKAIAEYTGGLFLVFKSGESFRTKFKYLAPASRGLLTSGQVSIKE